MSWQVRTALRFALVLVIGGIYVWCSVIVVIFTGFGQAGANRGGGHFKVTIWGGNASHKSGTLFIGKRGSHYVTLKVLQVPQLHEFAIYTRSQGGNER